MTSHSAEAQIEHAIKSMLATRCPDCCAGIDNPCFGAPVDTFHPARARRAAVKVKMRLINCEAAA